MKRMSAANVRSKRGPIEREPRTEGMTGRGVSSPHAGSRPSYTHLTRPGEAGRFERAAAWSKAAGRPLPPHMRQRTTPVRQAEPMSPVRREQGYLGTLPISHLTPAQRRRIRHKWNRAQARRS